MKGKNMTTVEKFLNEVWVSDELEKVGAWKHIHEFADRYDSTEFDCIHDHSTCIAILQSMDYEQDEIDEILEWFEDNGGYCDCEVGLNVLTRYC